MASRLGDMSFHFPQMPQSHLAARESHWTLPDGRTPFSTGLLVIFVGF